MAGTLTPTPYQTVLDGDGVAVSGAKIYTYVAGTTTNATTYTTSALSVANANPIVADSAGRYVAYLSAGANLRFIIKTSADVLIDDQDNVQSVPGSSVNLDIEGTVGEAVTAGQVVYLSSAAESPALTAGKWYLTDSDVAATSTSPQSIGVAVSAIAINTAGTIRLAGEVNSAGTVVVGTTYYVGATPGAIVSSAPANSRQVGVGLTSSSLLLAATTAVASLLPNPLTQDLLFVDATYDIGKSGASRPRDLFASRNAVVGGTLGVSGISTFTADLVATGASMSFQDNEGVVLGTGSDATIQYNGTDLVVAPAAVGSGDIVVTAASIEFADDEGVTLGTGKDATLQYDGTNVSLDTQAVGSGLLIVTGSAAISGVEIDNTATDGDPTLAFTLSGTSLFTMGVDDGDSDKFKIGTTAIGTNTALTIDGSQNIGIGTAAPTNMLTLGGSGNKIISRDTSDGSDNGALFLAGGGTEGSTRGATINLYGNEHAGVPGGLRIVAGDGDISLENGDVGIGTADPDYPLHVEVVDAKIAVQSTTGTNSTSFKAINTGGTLSIGLEENTGGVIVPGSGAYEGVIAHSGARAMSFATSNTRRMTIAAAGTVNVVGTFTAGTKTFQIQHPLPEKRDTHLLIHGCLEGPRLDLIYRGTINLLAGAATVDLDESSGMTAGTWELLCRDPQVFTTNETGWFHVRGTVSGSTLTITCEEADCTDTVSWMVVAERQDDDIKAQSSTDDDGHLILEPLIPETPPEEDDDDEGPRE